MITEKRHREIIDQTYRRTVEITGDPISGRVESCRIRVADGVVANKIQTAIPDVRAEVDEAGNLLAVLILSFPGEPDEFDRALQDLGADQATRCFVMGAMPAYFVT